MSEWIEPVVNRTSSDVDTVKSLVQRILSDGWSTLMSEEQSFFLGDMIGTLNHFCLNRVENNTKVLYNYIRTLGFPTYNDSYKEDWNYDDLPVIDDFTRILNNIIHIIHSEYPISTSLPANLDMPDYTQINAVEEVLLELKAIYETIPKSYKYCGTFNCGQDIILPKGVD